MSRSDGGVNTQSAEATPADLNAPVAYRSQENLELIDAATVRFKEYFNAPEIIQVFSRAELRKLYRDMTDDEFNETFKEYNKKAAIYDVDRIKSIPLSRTAKTPM